MSSTTESENELFIQKEVKFATEMNYKILNKAATNKEYREMETEKRVRLIAKDEYYSEFFSKYPIVCRLMIQMEEFSPIAFRKYIVLLNTKRPTEKERVEALGSPEKQWLWKNTLEAEYCKMLYMERSKDTNPETIEAYYNATLESLNSDTRKMFALYNEELEKAKKKKENNTNVLREELRNSLKKNNL